MATQSTQNITEQAARAVILEGSLAGAAAQEAQFLQEQEASQTASQEIWRAEIIREQARQRLIAEAEAEEEAIDGQEDAAGATATAKKISIMELAVVLLPAVVIDLAEFFVLFIGAIPFIGQPILGVYSAIDWVLNGCMAGLLFVWMAFHGIWPSSPKGLKTSALIGGTLIGESMPLISTIIPGWTGCTIFKIANSDKKSVPTKKT